MRRHLALIPLLFLVAACARSPRLGGATLPDDFSLSLCVAAPGDMSPAWFVLDADGTLRAATGQRAATTPAPPPVRTLTREHVRSLWRLCKGLDAAPAGEGVEVFVAARESRRTFRRAPTEPATAALAARLRDLAWAGDQ